MHIDVGPFFAIESMLTTLAVSRRHLKILTCFKSIIVTNEVQAQLLLHIGEIRR